jgi:hypothetical protein
MTFERVNEDQACPFSSSASKENRKSNRCKLKAPFSTALAPDSAFDSPVK